MPSSLGESFFESTKPQSKQVGKRRYPASNLVFGPHAPLLSALVDRHRLQGVAVPNATRDAAPGVPRARASLTPHTASSWYRCTLWVPREVNRWKRIVHLASFGSCPGTVPAVRRFEVENVRKPFVIPPGKCVALYAGNIGAKRELGLIVAVARRLQSTENIHFVICGHGAAHAALIESARGLDNLQMLPVQPSELFNQLNYADIHLPPPPHRKVVLPIWLCSAS